MSDNVSWFRRILLVVLVLVLAWFIHRLAVVRKLNDQQANLTVAFVSVLVALLAYLSSSETDMRRERQDVLRMIIAQQDQSFNSMDSMFAEHYPEGFRLYREMHINNLSLQATPDPPHDPIKRVQIESNMAHIIFRNIEDIVVLVEELDALDVEVSHLHEWMRTWVQWFGSPTLRQLWMWNEKLFSEQMRDFINRFILPRAM